MVAPMSEDSAADSTSAGNRHSDGGPATASQPRLRPGWALAVATWAIYTAGMAVAWSVTDNLYEDSDEVLKDTWWVLAILVILMWVIVRLSGLKVQRSFRLGWLSLVLIVPVGLLLLSAIITFTDSGTDWPTVLTVLGATLLVGIGEETAFRGIVLNSVATRTTVIPAVIVSAVLFGLMHSVNAMIQPVGTTIGQVVLTSLIGLTFGFVYVASGGNLILVIVMHWLYDFSLIGPQATSQGENPFSYGGLMLFGSMIIAIVVGVVKYRGVRWYGRTEAQPAPVGSQAT